MRKTFSLILATYGTQKIPLIKEFLFSINEQEYEDFELIIVDQNKDQSVKQLLDSKDWNFSFNYLKSSPGLSKARNVGLDAAKGHIVAFPDDDCLYTNNLLKRVDAFFKEKSEIDVLAIDTRDTISLKKLPYTKKVSGDFEFFKNDIFKTVTSISIFCKNYENIRFDERLGLGTRHSSCEEFDFVTQFFKRKSRAFFTDKLQVLHPDHSDLNFALIIKKIKKHALGHGAYFKKHLIFILPTALYYMLVSPLGGMVINIFKFNFEKTKMYYYFLATRLKGFLTF
ncbi:glycosyltransferase family 2 protein [Aquimarina sp. Aq107]|uniref:glycosyltransferase family 2 protein n=1 Tax=Aquimarina sp. Aq107 TaxID=1191912 RepID=UPI00131F3D87|nr:glycosyltransferase family 2 protein [Aquimarina sp. Aq107]